MTYKLLDCGLGQKLEQVGEYKLIRSAPQAKWKRLLSDQAWEQVDAIYEIDQGWNYLNKKMPKEWVIDFAGIKIKIKPTKTGQIGVFPEHLIITDVVKKIIKESNRELSILNLFAYTGVGSILMVQAGAKVCHVDGAKEMVTWGKTNLSLNEDIASNIRWITEDVTKFIKREIKRGNKYDGIILDPPSFGHGPKGEVWKFGNNINELLEDCKQLLSEQSSSFIALSTHTPGYDNKRLLHLLEARVELSSRQEGEMLIRADGGNDLSSGYYVIMS